MAADPEFAIHFWGLADHGRPHGIEPFQWESADYFRLARTKPRMLFPTSLKDTHMLFSMNLDYLRDNGHDLNFELDLVGPHERNIAHFTLTYQPVTSEMRRRLEPEGYTFNENHGDPIRACLSLPSTIPEQGIYRIVAQFGDRRVAIGHVNFVYTPAKPLTPDVIKGMLADPLSHTTIRLVIRCDECAASYAVYSAIERDGALERNGDVWQYDVPDNFKCGCGKVDWPMQYVRESLHGFLGIGMHDAPGNLCTREVTYERRYSHSIMREVVRGFKRLLNAETTESPFQEYIESNLAMLARFRARRIFVKPDLMGKFQPDFAVIDTQKRLVLIELERPARLFRKDGHVTQFVTHAYSQVNDWIALARRHYHAVLDALSLRDGDIAAIRGCVIAGRTDPQYKDSMHKLLDRPPYADVDFLTLDDLGDELLQISQSLQ